jgi:hypothetical protein
MTHNVRTTYYYFGGARVGMRQNNDVYWLHGDHLGSASLTTSITGAVVSEMRYYPFGETRWVSGTLPTDTLMLFTGAQGQVAIQTSQLNHIEKESRATTVIQEG